jgi:hypothetical protein
MARYRGDVEQARKELRDMGFSQSDARKHAPRRAEIQQSQGDRAVRPYSWLGGKAGHESEVWDD